MLGRLTHTIVGRSAPLYSNAMKASTCSLSTTTFTLFKTNFSTSTEKRDQKVDAALERSVIDRTMTRREFNNDRIDAVFSSMDKEGQGTITREQFMQAIKQIEESEVSKLRRSLSRNELSRSGSRSGTADRFGRTHSRSVPLMFDDDDKSSATVTASGGTATIGDYHQSELTDTDVAQSKTLGEILPSRVSTTMEVGVSKIFMAGFGWQGFSVIADMYGFAADTLGFALITGAGDFTGVAVGHTVWMMGKKALVDDTIDTTAELHTGILLGTAAFFSGTTWQPLVNLLHDTLHLGFNTSCALTLVGCGTAFYVGLRAGRTLWSPLLYGVESTNYANLKADAALSLSVGAATGCFVGTDLTFGAENWMAGVLGIEDTFSTIQGMAIAGSSTAIGFTAVQMMQNVAVKPGHNWVD